MARPTGAKLAVLVVAATWLTTAPPAHASFPGGNGKIAFSRNDGLYSHIFSMEADGSAQTELTFGTVGDRDPVWSPDGSRIVFDRTTDRGSALFVMNADGSGLKRITPSSVSAHPGSWSPQGQRVVFVGGSCLATIKVDGTSLRRLLCDGFSTSPKWSPAGNLIVFSYVPPSGPFNMLWTIRPDGSHLTQLTFSGIPDGSPDWAPDASHVAFERAGYPTSDVYTIDADGSNLVDLTADAPTDRNGEPAYSPDGTRMAYDCSQSGIFGVDVCVMDADGSNFTQLTTDAKSYAANWQPVP